MQTCSLMLNGPGFKDQMYLKVLNFLVGSNFSKALPMGKEISWTTILLMKRPGSGDLLENKSFERRMRPTSHGKDLIEARAEQTHDDTDGPPR